MLNVVERIKQYSDIDLLSIRGKLDTQGGKLEDEVSTDMEPFRRTNDLLIETVEAGSSISETLERANPADVAAYFRAVRLWRHFDKLTVLAMRMDAEAERRSIIGVAR